MIPLLIDPAQAFVGAAPRMAGFKQAVRLLLSPPIATDNITDDHLLIYSPLSVLEPTEGLFWSRRMGSFYAGKALVFGAAVDGAPTAPGRGMENAIRDDIVFLGSGPEAKKALVELVSGIWGSDG